eukprot:6470411-Amphidinium_carterae.4
MSFVARRAASVHRVTLCTSDHQPSPRLQEGCQAVISDAFPEPLRRDIRYWSESIWGQIPTTTRVGGVFRFCPRVRSALTFMLENLGKPVILTGAPFESVLRAQIAPSVYRGSTSIKVEATPSV